MALRRPRPGLSDSAFNRWLRRERERCAWDWALDLRPVRTKADFVRLLRSHFDERVRLEALADYTLTATVGPRFWHHLSGILGGHFGRVRVRVVGWDEFRRRLPMVAGQLETCLQLIRRETGVSGFRVDYDREPAARFRTFIRYLFLPPGRTPTMPGVVKALRGYRWAQPTTIRAKAWKDLELDDLESTKRVRRVTAAGAEVDLGGHYLHLALNTDAKQVTSLRKALAEIAWHEPAELRSCRAVLEVWSWDADPKWALDKRRAEVIECIRAA